MMHDTGLLMGCKEGDVKQAVMCGLYLQQRLQESLSSPSAFMQDIGKAGER